jgi:hypothetical protein
VEDAALPVWEGSAAVVEASAVAVVSTAVDVAELSCQILEVVLAAVVADVVEETEVLARAAIVM